MICIIALVVFGIMGIFSFSYRQLFYEAFDCTFRRLTLRKCQSGLDQKSRSKLTAKIMKVSPFLAKQFYKYFRVIEFLFFVIFIWSIVQSSLAGYNFYMYGNCNGPDESGFCIFDPTGSNSAFSGIAQDSCNVEGDVGSLKEMSLKNINLSDFAILHSGNPDKILFFVGCYDCEYTKETYPLLEKLIKEKNPTVYFAHLPIREDMDLFTRYGNCVYEKEGSEKLKEFNTHMFSQDECLIESCTAVISKIGLNTTEYDECASSNESISLFEKQYNQLKDIGIYGTPTIFIDDEVLVGPKPYRVYARALK